MARTGAGEAWACPEHGVVRPLWRPAEPSYDALVEHLALAGPFPTYTPWPLGPGWQVTDFAVVGDHGGAVATLLGVSGTSELDGPVEVLLVTEEAGVGLGARCAGTVGDDPGREVGDGPPACRVRLGSQQVSLWPVSTGHRTGEWDRSVVAGEAEGRWLWLVLRPASAMLLLQDDWILRDVAGLGMSLVELPFGPSGTSW